MSVPSHTAEQPIEHQNGFASVLHVDSEDGYRKLAGKNHVSAAVC